ncbi:MAG TPA: 6-hydroxymethylpterin diphosphokinase MptE-like protein [Luteitalea sp.]|nr:6-hydroxymethylpterin diphosphokinase MptE-like protein [Luteitalea sp.]
MGSRVEWATANRSTMARMAGLGVPAVADVTAIRLDGESDVSGVSMIGANGAWLRVHSQRRPVDEARRAVDDALGERDVPPVVVLLGVGLGFAIDDVLARRPDARIAALELAPELLAAFCERRDWSALLASRQLVVAAAPGYALDLSSWDDDVLADAPLVIVHPVIARERVDAFAAAHDAWRQALFERRANAGARRAFSALYVRHTLANAPRLTTESDVAALNGVGAGTPALICAAGPSLDRLLPAIARHRTRLLIIAVDTTVRPLTHAGIEPDLVVAIDPTTLNGRHLVDLPRLRHAHLVTEASVDPRAVNAFAGRVFFARVGRFHPWPWLEAHGASCGQVQVWGSVLTAACQLAIRLGCGPIMLGGTDLAYTDGQPYCRHTTFEADWEAQAERDGIDVPEVWRRRLRDAATREPDVHGEPTVTAPHLIAFRNWVRAFVASAPSHTFINVTGAGILHGPGIAQASLGEALHGLPDQIGIGSRLAVAHQSMRVAGDELAPSLADLAATSVEDEPYRTWATEAHDLDVQAVRRVVASASRRVGAGLAAPAAPRNRTMTDLNALEWIDVPYDAASFWAKAPMQWVVPPEAIRTYAYVLQGRTMTLSFTISGASVQGVTTNEIYVRIPDDYLPARSVVNAVWIGTSGYKEMGYARTHRGLPMVVVLRASEVNFGPETGGFSVFGQITFEVQ